MNDNRRTAKVEISVADDGEHCSPNCRYGQDETCSLIVAVNGRCTPRELDYEREAAFGHYYRCRACLAAEVKR